jgi:uncharacterized low-complexity protein
VSSALSGIAVEKRRQVAATLGLFAVLFVAVGVVAETGSAPTLVRVFAVAAILVALLLGLAAWGVVHSVRADLAAARVDEAIDEVMATAGADLQCGCGAAHDPDELHVSDDPCTHDGAGGDCTHSCDTCVLAAMRPSPHVPREQRLNR